MEFNDFKANRLIESIPIYFSGSEKAPVTFVMLKPTKVELSWIGKIDDDKLCFHCPAGYTVKTLLSSFKFDEGDVSYMYLLPYATVADMEPSNEVIDLFFANFMQTIDKNKPFFILAYGYKVFHYLADRLFHYNLDQEDFLLFCEESKILENDNYTVIPINDIDDNLNYRTRKKFIAQINLIYSAIVKLKVKQNGR